MTVFLFFDRQFICGFLILLLCVSGLLFMILLLLLNHYYQFFEDQVYEVCQERLIALNTLRIAEY